MATSEYETFDAERRRPLTSNRADVEEYLRNLYERSMGDAPVSPVATFATDLTPQPSRKPSFDSMLGVDFPAFDNVRKQNELELEADKQAADDAVAAAGLPARPLPGYGAPPVIAAGPRRPLSPAATEDGSGGPVGYLAALRRAQGMDDLSAAVGRSNAAMQQLANITSRGVFQPQALSPMPSEVAKEEKRRQVVMDYLRQQREDANAAVDNEYKRGLLKRMAEPKPVAAPKPGLTQEQIDEKFAADLDNAKALAEARRRSPPPRVVKAPSPPRPEKEPKPVEGIAAGYEIDPKRPPSRDQVNKFGEIVATRLELQGMTSRLRDLVSKYAFLERATPGSGKTAISQLATQIQIKAKDIAGLGALSGPDMSLMTAMASNPALVETALTDVKAQLDGLDWWSRNAEQSKAKAWGFQPANKPAPKTVITKSEEDRLKELEAKEKAGTLGGK